MSFANLNLAISDTIHRLIKKHRDTADLHITRIMGAFVVVSKGRILEIDRSHALQYCPLQRMLSNMGMEDYLYEKIQRFGHFTANREVARASAGVPFGTSEMLAAALRKKVLDCAITVCDGAGTVVTSSQEIVQGIGARMNGLFYTTAIPEVQMKLREHRCILFDDAAIDQIRGLNAALNAGYKKIGITVNVCYGENFLEMRRTEKEKDVVLIIAGICSTGAGRRRAKEAAEHADLTWSCASKYMREFGRTALLQITHGIPVFVYTRKGLDLVAAYSDKAGASVIKSLKPGKQYMLAYGAGPCQVRLGENLLALKEAQLPVPGKHEPVPLR